VPNRPPSSRTRIAELVIPRKRGRITADVPGGNAAGDPNSWARLGDRPHPEAAETSPHFGPYRFLLGRYTDAATLMWAESLARDANLAPHDVLISKGWVSETDYADALGDALGLLVFPWGFTLAAPRGVACPPLPITLIGVGVWALVNGQAVFLVSATAAAPDILQRLLTTPEIADWPVALAPHSSIDAERERADRRQRLDFATDGLKRTTPGLSAAHPATGRQQAVLWLLFATLAGGLYRDPLSALTALSAALGLPFLFVTVMRVLTLRQSLKRRTVHRLATRRHMSDTDLPAYSVLVPLFREAAVLPDLVEALLRLDYPAGKLEVLLVLEAADIETHASLMTFKLPGHFRIVIVPDSKPRTKPKALNYALGLSHGDYIVVYDAEDRPEPDQLRAALAKFRGAPEPLACVQARLNIYNADENWFTRQFAIEYSALFDAILPMLATYRLPIPLGGTSNHFPRSVLEHLGGWDPYNVTEDADLGIRIARLGWQTEMINSTTWEEAPARFRDWLPQRTRWFKGWMQTYLVHTRTPITLGRDLGFKRALGLHVYIAGLILSSLAHPVMYLLLIAHWLSGQAFAPPAGSINAAVWWASWASLGIGYLSSVLVAIIAVRKRHPNLVRAALWMPVYWLLISVAAYRALWQLYRDPFLWEKTPHGRKRRR
jgi:glycosyltransferase XagB